jgi:hypothetical protein
MSNSEMRALIKQSGLRREDVADLLGVSLHTVRAWMRPDGSRNGCGCPRRRVDALRFLLGESLGEMGDAERRVVGDMVRGGR